VQFVGLDEEEFPAAEWRERVIESLSKAFLFAD